MTENSLADAVYATGKPEQTAHLDLLLHQEEARYLTLKHFVEFYKN